MSVFAKRIQFESGSTKPSMKYFYFPGIISKMPRGHLKKKNWPVPHWRHKRDVYLIIKKTVTQMPEGHKINDLFTSSRYAPMGHFFISHSGLFTLTMRQTWWADDISKFWQKLQPKKSKIWQKLQNKSKIIEF